MDEPKKTYFICWVNKSWYQKCIITILYAWSPTISKINLHRKKIRVRVLQKIDLLERNRTVTQTEWSLFKWYKLEVYGILELLRFRSVRIHVTGSINFWFQIRNVNLMLTLYSVSYQVSGRWTKMNFQDSLKDLCTSLKQILS